MISTNDKEKREKLLLSDTERVTMHRLLRIAKNANNNKIKQIKLGEMECDRIGTKEAIEGILSNNGITANIAQYISRLGYRFGHEIVEEGRVGDKVNRLILYLKWQ